ncbi:MAG: 16S rRNA (adenine(1518)-N(6)/adenine(1519)-N(6))-dimethyltransferase RsmA, partial [Chitinophagaceae bacterium]
YSGEPLNIQNEKKFFTLVKTAFNQRRKILRNPLKPFFSKEILGKDIFAKRAEELSVSEFIELSNQML